MIVILFGLADILAGLSLALVNFGVGGVMVYLALASAAYLLVKGVVFFFDFASFLDLVSALMIILALFGFRTLWAYVFAAWLLQKGIRSLM